MYRLDLIIFCTLTLLVSCGTGKSKSDRSDDGPRQNADVQASPLRHNVLVIDDGFDLNHPVFSNKVVARYRLRCGQNQELVIDAGKDYAAQKQNFIDYLTYDNNDCILSNKLPFEATKALESIQGKRNEWNNAIRTKSIAEVYAGREAEANSIFGIVTDNGRYHGTNTAGLIAYQNDKVNLIVMQLELASPQSTTTSAKTQSDFCPSQNDINFTAKLFSDPDVIKAYAEAPLATVSSQDVAINSLIERHKVEFVNKSYGLLPKLAIQSRLDAAGCDVDISPVFAARANMIQYRKQQLDNDSPNTLVFQAAGNEGLSINSLEESWDCTTPNDQTILVGGLDYEFEKPEWSNFGNCVEMYAVGDRVITPAPLDFLGISSGTSFSSPMALRYATLTSAKGEPATDIKARLTDELDSRKFMTEGHFPRELIYFIPDQITSYSLVQKASLRIAPTFRKPDIDKRRVPKLLRHLF